MCPFLFIAILELSIGPGGSERHKTINHRKHTKYPNQKWNATKIYNEVLQELLPYWLITTKHDANIQFQTFRYFRSLSSRDEKWLTNVLAFDKAFPFPEPLHADTVYHHRRLLLLKRLIELQGQKRGGKRRKHMRPWDVERKNPLPERFFMKYLPTPMLLI